MINSRYKLVYAVLIFLISFLLGEYYFVLPIKNEINTMLKTKLQLNQAILFHPKIKKAKNFIVKREDLSWPAQWLADVIRISQSYALQLNYSVKNEGEKMLVKNQMTGQYKKINFFLSELSQLSYPMLQTKFILTAMGKENVKLQLDLNVMPYQVIPTKKPLNIKIKNPFCIQPNFNLNHDDIMKIPISQIKLVGILQHAEKYQALFSLPSGLLVMHTLKAIVGLEKFIITRITATEVELSNMNHQQIILKIKNL